MAARRWRNSDLDRIAQDLWRQARARRRAGASAAAALERAAGLVDLAWCELALSSGRTIRPASEEEDPAGVLVGAADVGLIRGALSWDYAAAGAWPCRCVGCDRRVFVSPDRAGDELRRSPVAFVSCQGCVAVIAAELARTGEALGAKAGA